MAKSHKWMVQILQTLSTNIDNKRPNKPATLEEATSKHDWPEWKKAMKSKYNLLIENGTWEVGSLPTEANIFTDR